MENMNNPTKRKDSETDPTPCPVFSPLYLSILLVFFELHVHSSCVLMLLFIFISLILLAFT